MIHLVIADDHAVVRHGIKQILALAPDIELAGEATDGAEALRYVREGKLDMLLLDMNMPGISGLDLISRIKSMLTSLPVLVFTMHNDAHLAKRAIQAGASGFVSKDVGPKDLLSAIRKVYAGERYLDPEMAEQIAMDALLTNSQPRHSLLSNREMEVFHLLVAGKSSKEIAEKLCLSVKTVSTHKTNLMEKLSLSSVADLVRYSTQHGLDNEA